MSEQGTWLIRTAKNEIRGPVSQEELLDQVARGEVLLEDEVCRADGFWFYLHEGDETRAQLGIDPPHVRRRGDDEETQTDTETETLVPQAEKKSGSKRKKQPTIEVVGQEMERVSYLRMLAFGGVVLVVFLVAGAIRVLWTS